jgi:hypothetical protein
MEGKFLTKDQRVNMATQIRKTHFTLGGGCKSYNTTSHNTLKHQDRKPGAQFQVDLSKDLRKTHLVMGSDNSKKASEFTVSYPPKNTDGNRADLPKTDLKKHYAVLGTTMSGYNTEVSHHYKPGFVSVQDVESARKIERNLRGHHFQLGTDRPTQRTTFASDFESKTAEKAKVVTEVKNDLRKSHFVLGKAPKMLKSTSQSNFTSPSGPAMFEMQRNGEIRKEHFVLGTDRPTLASTHNKFFTRKEEGRQDLNVEKMKDLRSSHLVLGKEQACFSTSSLLNKPQTARPELQKDLHGLNIRATHFKLGSDTPKFQTSYLASTALTSPVLQTESSDSQRHLQSNIYFGQGKVPKTVAQDSYRHPNPKEIEKPDPKLIKELRNHHFKLGKNESEYKTTYSDLGKGKGEPGMFEESRRQDLRTSHFKVGNENKHLLTTNQNDFVKYSESGSKSDGCLSKNLRKTHFSVGADKGQWMTEQRTNFNWIQPVPDREFKITLI